MISYSERERILPRAIKTAYEFLVMGADAPAKIILKDVLDAAGEGGLTNKQ